MLSTAGTMTTFPSPCAAKAPSDDDLEAQAIVTCLPTQTILGQLKVMNLSKRIRSLVSGPTSEGYMNVSDKPVEAMATCTPPEDTTEKGASDGPQLLASFLSPALAARHLNTLNHSMRIPAIGMGPTSEGYTSLSSPERCSADANARLQEGTTGGTSDSQKCSTIASCDSQRCSTSATPAVQGFSECATPDDSRRFSCSAVYGLQRFPGSTTSDSRRFSTSAATYESRRFSTSAATSDSQRCSTGGVEFTIYNPKTGAVTEVPAIANSKKVPDPVRDPVGSMKALLTPATSMETFLRIVCTEETLVSSSEARPQLGVPNSRRYPSELLAPPGLLKRSASSQDSERCSSEVLAPKRSASTRDLDLSTTLTGPEIDVAEDQDEYCNSNVSYSLPLEVVDNLLPNLKVDSQIVEEPQGRQPISGRAPLIASIPSEHFPTVYVGSERKKFIIPFQVITHQLFKQLLDSEHYRVEEIDGAFSIVLLCDIDYFQRLLFFIDQRKNYDIEAHKGRTSLSSCSKRCDIVARVPGISA